MSAKRIQVKDKHFKNYMSAEEIDCIVEELANKINEDYKGEDPIFLPILNGSFIFAADLIRKIDVQHQISFVKVASYSGVESSGKVKQIIGFGDEVVGKDIILVEDIVDTGLTLEDILVQMKEIGVKSVKIASLLYKPDSFKGSYKVDYIGKSIPNDFILGYGLDYDGYGRNLKDIYVID